MISLHIYLLISNAAYSCQTSKSRFLSENMKLIGQNRLVFLLRRQVNEAERQAKRADNFVISLRNQVLLVIRFFGPDTLINFLPFFHTTRLFGPIRLLGTRE